MVKVFKENDHLKTSKILYGKRLFFLGSSIFYGETNQGHSFIDLLSENFPCTRITKETVSGTTLAKKDLKNNSYIERLEKVVEMNPDSEFIIKDDALIVQLSTNDFYLKVDEGVLTSTKNKDIASFDASTIIGAIEHIISYALNINPKIQIIFISCPILSSWREKEAYKKFNDEIIPKIIKKWNIKFLDLLNYQCENNGLYKIDKESTKGYFSDDIHPNKLGYEEFLYPIIKEFLESLFLDE